MLIFPLTSLLDEDKCSDFLVGILHPNGLRCPDCHGDYSSFRVHRHDRHPVLYYRCSCGRVFNAWTGTLLQGTHWKCSTWVQVIQGFAKGVSTRHLAIELNLERTNLLDLRHKCQGFLTAFSPCGTIAGSSDGSGRNVSERRRKRGKT